MPADPEPRPSAATAADEPVGESPTRYWGNAKRLDLVCKVIDSRLADRSLDKAAVSRAAHLSPSTLYRLLAPFGGVGPFIIRRRLEVVRQLLATAGQRDTLAELAERVGFASASHLSRAFLAQFGMRPGEFRRASRDPEASLLAAQRLRLATTDFSG